MYITISKKATITRLLLPAIGSQTSTHIACKTSVAKLRTSKERPNKPGKPVKLKNHPFACWSLEEAHATNREFSSRILHSVLLRSFNFDLIYSKAYKRSC